MPNNARQRGDYFERQTRAALEAHGWLVVRSAGSFGCADLVALKADRTPMLISCKLTGHLPSSQRGQLADYAARAGAFPVKAWRMRPGWVGLLIITRHGTAALPAIHVPGRKVGDKPQPDGLLPAGEQLALPLG